MAHFLQGESGFISGCATRASGIQKSWRSIPACGWSIGVGDTYMRLKQYDEAEKALKQALWLNESFTVRTSCWVKSSCKKVIRSWRVGSWNARSSSIRKLYAHYALGRSYQKLGRTEDANREFTLQRSLRAEKQTADQDTMEQKMH